MEVRALGGTNVLDLSDDETAAFRRRLEDAGIAVSSVGSPIGKTPIRSDLEAHFARFRIALRRADQLGCRFVRVFSFRHEGEEAEQVRGEVIGQMRRMTDAAAEAGITLVLENESRIYGDVPERCADLIESVGSPHLRGLFDPANFVTCGCDPLQAWERLADHVVWFHIKDKVAATDRVVPAGHGDGEVEADPRRRPRPRLQRLPVDRAAPESGRPRLRGHRRRALRHRHGGPAPGARPARSAGGLMPRRRGRPQPDLQDRRFCPPTSAAEGGSHQPGRAPGIATTGNRRLCSSTSAGRRVHRPGAGLDARRRRSQSS